MGLLHMAQQLKTRFKTPEGKYSLVSERTSGLCLFNPTRPIKLTYAQVFEGSESTPFILLNFHDFILIFSYTGTSKVAFRSTVVILSCFGRILQFQDAYGDGIWVVASGPAEKVGMSGIDQS